jgi:hypothetical protein
MKKLKGFRNRYRQNMPWSEAVLKDVRSLLKDSIAFVRNGFRLPVIVVHPDYPSKKTTIYKISRKLGYRITNKRLKKPKVVMWFHDTTYATSELLVQHYPNQSVINRNCTDISKKHVDLIHQQVFGYSTIIDPVSHSGQAVMKSDINALHDGEIIRCPLTEIRPGVIYQIVIDNEVGKGEYIDYRVPVIRGEIPLVYSKFKRADVRFTNHVHRSELHKPEAIFTQQEMDAIRKMADAMGAEFCEFDVLRDNGSGLIYVIDVNKTPYGPPSGLPKADSMRAISMLTDSFRNAFLN